MRSQHHSRGAVCIRGDGVKSTILLVSVLPKGENSVEGCEETCVHAWMHGCMDVWHSADVGECRQLGDVSQLCATGEKGNVSR